MSNASVMSQQPSTTSNGASTALAKNSFARVESFIDRTFQECDRLMNHVLQERPSQQPLPQASKCSRQPSGQGVSLFNSGRRRYHSHSHTIEKQPSARRPNRPNHASNRKSTIARESGKVTTGRAPTRSMSKKPATLSKTANDSIDRQGCRSEEYSFATALTPARSAETSRQAAFKPVRANSPKPLVSKEEPLPPPPSSPVKCLATTAFPTDSPSTDKTGSCTFASNSPMLTSQSGEVAAYRASEVATPVKIIDSDLFVPKRAARSVINTPSKTSKGSLKKQLQRSTMQTPPRATRTQPNNKTTNESRARSQSLPRTIPVRDVAVQGSLASTEGSVTAFKEATHNESPKEPRRIPAKSGAGRSSASQQRQVQKQQTALPPVQQWPIISFNSCPVHGLRRVYSCPVHGSQQNLYASRGPEKKMHLSKTVRQTQEIPVRASGSREHMNVSTPPPKHVRQTRAMNRELIHAPDSPATQPARRTPSGQAMADWKTGSRRSSLGKSTTEDQVSPVRTRSRSMVQNAAVASGAPAATLVYGETPLTRKGGRITQMPIDRSTLRWPHTAPTSKTGIQRTPLRIGTNASAGGFRIASKVGTDSKDNLAVTARIVREESSGSLSRSTGNESLHYELQLNQAPGKNTQSKFKAMQFMHNKDGAEIWVNERKVWSEKPQK